MRQEVKREREGGRDREMSVCRESNSGCPKRKSAICWHAAHKAIGTDRKVILSCNNFYCIFNQINAYKSMQNKA